MSIESFYPIPSSWPFLKEMSDRYPSLFLEIHAIAYFCRDIELSEEDASLCLSILLSSRIGHLCLSLKSSSSEIFLESCDASKEEGKRFAELVEGASGDCLERYPELPFLRKGERLYSLKNWHCERRIVDYISSVEGESFWSCLDKKSFDALLHKKSLFPAQLKAVESIVNNPLSFVVGGPGTGKTHMARTLIELIFGSLKKDWPYFEMVLTAPTAKAVLRLREGLEHFPLKLQTLHSLLWTCQDQLRVDCILIDEASMLDAELMAKLCASLSKKTRLIFLGDDQQLPPVGLGQVFAQLLQALEKKRPSCIARLELCRRTESKGILSLADAVKRGELSEIKKLFDQDSDLSLLPLQEGKKGEEQRKKMIDERLECFTHLQGRLPDRKDFVSWNESVLLSPLRKGFYGVDMINLLSEQAMKKKLLEKDFIIFPIVFTKNHAKTGICNGDIAFLKRGKDALDDLIFYLDIQEGAMETLSPHIAPPFDYAFCLSIHKSQGSEYSHVHILLPRGGEFLGRQGLYTAITRARLSVSLYVAEESLAKGIEKLSLRQSGLVEALSV